MKKRNLICGAVCLTLAGSMVLSSCGKRGKTRDSETTPLVVSSEALDSVFNPYFYTTGPDGNVVGQTQIGMLSTDKDGNLVCGGKRTLRRARLYDAYSRNTAGL